MIIKIDLVSTKKNNKFPEMCKNFKLLHLKYNKKIYLINGFLFHILRNCNIVLNIKNGS